MGEKGEYSRHTWPSSFMKTSAATAHSCGKKWLSSTRENTQGQFAPFRLAALIGKAAEQLRLKPHT